MNPKAGCAGSVLNLLQMKEFNHQAELETGILEEECSESDETVFQRTRDKKRHAQKRITFENCVAMTVSGYSFYVHCASNAGPYRRYPGS